MTTRHQGTVHKQEDILDHTFSCISDVDCASQKATVATSLRMGISIEQSLPSKRATSGLVCIGPLEMGPRKSMRGRFGSILRLSMDDKTAGVE